VTVEPGSEWTSKASGTKYTVTEVTGEQVAWRSEDGRLGVDTIEAWRADMVKGSILDVQFPSRAPWTPGEVAKLAEWQNCGWVHPFTCGACRDTLGTDGNERKLVPTVRGWECPTCDYTQNWCHQFMLDGPPPSPFGTRPSNDIAVDPAVLVLALRGATALKVDPDLIVLCATTAATHAAACAAAGVISKLVEVLTVIAVSVEDPVAANAARTVADQLGLSHG